MKKRRNSIIAGILAMILTVSVMGCGETSGQKTEDYASLSAVELKYQDVNSESVMDFYIRIFQRSMNAGENTLISPLSILIGMGMSANGARGETLSQIEQVLGMPIDQLNSWVQTYCKQLPQGEKYHLYPANSIWFRDTKSFKVSNDFMETAEEYYEAESYKEPFDDSTKEAINSWVNDKTEGMIPEILQGISQDAMMILLNALTFEAEWASVYLENDIKIGIFTTEDGETKDVEFMYSEVGQYLEDDMATGFFKNYSEGKYAFAALLPKPGVSVEEYVKTLTGEHIADLLRNPKEITVETKLPKFTTEYYVELIPILQEMGMTDAFDSSKADLSGLGTHKKENLIISDIAHKTFIKVDENGTKAAAVTMTAAAIECEIEAEKVYLDRPFVYMLIDRDANLPIFIGTMMNPEA